MKGRTSLKHKRNEDIKTELNCIYELGHIKRGFSRKWKQYTKRMNEERLTDVGRPIEK